jgi:hypothetical protein
LLEQHQELYIPPDERSQQHAQRKIQMLDDRVRNWAAAVIAFLPKGLSILEDEARIVGLVSSAFILPSRAASTWRWMPRAGRNLCPLGSVAFSPSSAMVRTTGR